jgi:hypothetical protein
MAVQDFHQIETSKSGGINPVLASEDILLDEFFSLVASIAGRLTSNNIKEQNVENSIDQREATQ